MTKRYTVNQSPLGGYFVYDEETDFQFPTISEMEADIFCEKLNEQDQKIKELEQELFSTKVEKLDDRLAEYGGPDDEEVWQKEFGMSSREAKKKAGWWV